MGKRGSSRAAWRTSPVGALSGLIGRLQSFSGTGSSLNTLLRGGTAVSQSLTIWSPGPGSGESPTESHLWSVGDNGEPAASEGGRERLFPGAQLGKNFLFFWGWCGRGRLRRCTAVERTLWNTLGEYLGQVRFHQKKKEKKKEKVLVNFEPPQQQQQKIFSAANAVSSTTGFDQMLAYFNNVKVLVFKSVLNQIFHLKQDWLFRC